MRKEVYTQRRLALIADAQKAIDSGDIKEYDNKIKEIEKLDDQYEKEAEAQANLDALSGARLGGGTELLTGTIETFGGPVSGFYDKYDTPEYRTAFMNYVTKRTPIPAEFRNDADATTATTDVSAVIPTTTLNKIVERMETLGTLLNLVTRTAFKGGLIIPTSSVKPTASWVSEGSGTYTQKEEVDGTIVFAYHKLKVAVAMTLEVETMAYSAFEVKFVKDVADAMVRALEQAIISGNGSISPKGILTETPVTGQAIEIASGTALDYATLMAMEAALPSEYEGGAAWAMTKKTFIAFQAITDDNGQPIARVNYGIGGKPERTLNGRTVVIVNQNYMSNYTPTVVADTKVAFIFRFEDYTLNTSLDVTVSTYEDHNTDNKIRKAVMLVDGKVVDKNSLVTLTVKA